MKFVLCAHIHQPIGNFDFVFEKLTKESYRPFLQALKRHPGVPWSLHAGGCLFEWWEKHDHKMLDLIGKMASNGQLELISGGFYEPILASIPREDRLGQIALMRDYLASKFGAKATGSWLTERVWEPGLAADLADAGIEYALLDDRHFLTAGFSKDSLNHYYLTEAEGKTIAIFPMDMKLRYMIPFRPRQELEGYLRHLASKKDNDLTVYADDGEKFGGWPGTKKWVYEDGWLEGFLSDLERWNNDFLNLTSFQNVLKTTKPAGLCYLPTSSYAEMETWALPSEAAIEFEETGRRLALSPDSPSPFLRGSIWKNFFVKYPEANWMNKTVSSLSRKLRQDKKEASPEALRQLWSSQCNDAYWHGVFGGLYMPHLRRAIWSNIAWLKNYLAEPKKISTYAVDLDLDGHEECFIVTPKWSAAVKPNAGAGLVEFTLLKEKINLLDTLARRPEAYHRRIAQKLASKADLVYDAGCRYSFIDRILGANATIDDFTAGKLISLCPDNASCRFTIGKNKIKTTLGGDGEIKVKIDKEYLAVPDDNLKVKYRLSSQEPTEFILGIEWNLNLGHDAKCEAVSLNAIYFDKPAITQDFQKIQIKSSLIPGGFSIACSRLGQLWSFPVYTISQSEKDYDRVLQSIALMGVWRVSLEPAKPWKLEIIWGITPNEKKILRAKIIINRV